MIQDRLVHCLRRSPDLFDQGDRAPCAVDTVKIQVDPGFFRMVSEDLLLFRDPEKAVIVDDAPDTPPDLSGMAFHHLCMAISI